MIAGVEPSKLWTRTSRALELASLATAAVAGALTAGTLVRLDAGTARLAEPLDAMLAWMLCAALVGAGLAMGRRIPPATVVRYRRPLIVLLAAALVWTLLGVARPALGAADGLTGEYFANAEWNGAPAFSVADAEPSAAIMRQRWNGVPPDRFSVRWTGFLTVGRSGLYTFTTASDDGSQLIVDNRLVVDNGGPHSLTTRTGSIRLARGSHAVVLRYEQFGAISALEWSWARDGGAVSPVPAWALSQRRSSYARGVAARMVDLGLLSVAVLIVVATASYVRVGLAGEAVRQVAFDVTHAYRNTASLACSALVLAGILFFPWPDGGELFRSVDATVRDLNRTALAMLAGFDTFQANVNTPQTGEYVLGARVEEMLAMLRRHEVRRYQISDSIAENAWVSQQIVASAWPRQREADAKARFVLNGEPPIPACELIDRQTDVSLVYCP